MVCWAISTYYSTAVETKHNLQLLQAHIMNHLIDSYKKGYTVRSAFRVAFYTVSTVALWEVFLDYGIFPALPFLDKGLTYALCMPRGGA
jgi:hypothetical protein